MIIALRTDSPQATIELFDTSGAPLDSYSWQADRQLATGLLKTLHSRLKGQGADWGDVSGLILFQGPGSFTGLRIGAATCNALAHAQQIPIVGATGDDWVQQGLKRLLDGQNDRVVMPHYGAEANITRRKK